MASSGNDPLEVKIGGISPYIDLIYGKYLQSISSWRLGSKHENIWVGYDLGCLPNPPPVTGVQSPEGQNGMPHNHCKEMRFHYSNAAWFSFFWSSKPWRTRCATVKTWYMAYGHPFFINGNGHVNPSQWNDEMSIPWYTIHLLHIESILNPQKKWNRIHRDSPSSSSW